MNVSIIHRAARADREDNVRRLLALFPHAKVLSAMEPDWGSSAMTKAVRGCSLSHLLAVRHSPCNEPLLVIEDDAVLEGELPSFKDVPSDAAITLFGAEAVHYGDSRGGYREVLPPFFGSHAVLYSPKFVHSSALVDAALLVASQELGANAGQMAYEGVLLGAVSRSGLKIYRPDRIPFTTLESVSDTFETMAPPRRRGLEAVDSEPLLPWSTWDEVFEPWAGKRAHLLYVGGNQGDLLIGAATRQLFQHHGIVEVPIADAEVTFYPGGGSIAGRYPFRDRDLAFHNTSLPKVCLPQTWERPDAYAELADVIWVRDHTSTNHCARAKFAHDLALAYRSPVPQSTSTEVGVFFRNDAEAAGRPAGNMMDPCADLPHSHLAYLLRARQFGTIHTNRLHFAIAGLLVGADVTLYPNDYHKNESVYEASLKALGCRWAAHYSPE
jgi:hypothetical protein